MNALDQYRGGQQPSSDVIGEILNAVRGRCVLIFGDEAVGKSTLCAMLASRISGRKVLLALDENILDEFGDALKKLAGWEVWEIESDVHLVRCVKLLTRPPSWHRESNKPRPAFIAIDSITSIVEVVDIDDPRDMRYNLIPNRVGRKVAFLLSRYCRKHGYTAVITAHPTSLIPVKTPNGRTVQRTWYGRPYKPTMVSRALRHLRLILELRKVEKKEDDKLATKRILEVVFDRHNKLTGKSWLLPHIEVKV